MLQVLWNIFKSVYSLLYSILRPLRRLVCRRRRVDESDGSELMSVSTGAEVLPTQNTLVYGQAVESNDDEIEMEGWDAWNDSPPSVTPAPPPPSQSVSTTNGMMGRPPASVVQNYHYNNKLAEPEPEPEPDFFHDMTPEVKRQRKLYVGQRDAASNHHSTSLISKMAVMSDIPTPGSELGEWVEENNGWDTGDTMEDLSWQAEEAIKEKKRRERMERQMEQQRKKQRKEEMRGMKNSAAILATKLS